MENGVTDISVVKQQVEDYLTDTADSRALSERDRDYRDGKQWTAKEEAKLRARNQAPIVINRIRAKVEGLIGLYNMRRSDPKAYPRTRKHEKSAHAITDALRFAADSTDLQTVKLECADDFWVEGTCGAIVDVRQKKNGEIEVRVKRIPWDRIYYDTNSRALDFSDARYKGLMMWMGVDEVKEYWPDVDAESLLNAGDGTDDTFEDRPRWQDKKRRRVRLAYHFYVVGGKWHYCIFSGDTFVVKPQESPFLDDEGDAACIIELASANIDRNNARYGEVRSYISPQDEINHRRSKALHLLSQRQTAGLKGAIDVKALKRELAKPDGHVEINGDKDSFQVLPTGDMANGQIELYMDAKAELDAVGFNAQLAGERQSGDLSGKAIDRLQQAGTVELNRQYAVLNGWEKRIYRQMWARIKQFWTEETWIRVTDDHDDLRWVGLNSEMTAQAWMEEQINDEAAPLSQRRQLAASYQFLMQAAKGPPPEMVQAAQQGDEQAIAAVQQALQVQPVAQAKLDEIVSVSNPVPEIDVDIILEQSFDVINIEQEQFELLANFAQGSPDVDIIDLIELSQIRGKETLIDKIEKRRQERMQAQGNLAQIEAESKQAITAKTLSETKVNEQTAIQKNIENALLIENPPNQVTSVAV